MQTDAQGKTRISTNRLIAWALGFAVVFIVAISMVAASGEADPTAVDPGAQSKVTSIVNASVIVFREGLEAVLIFAAITASFLGTRQGYRRPVVLGVASAFLATVLTWFVMTSVVQSLPLSNDVLLALTGLVAVVVLLLVMNWFFHKVYWTDHIKDLNSRKRDLVTSSEGGEKVKYWGFVALGFTAVYREGFEVVLFLQNLNLVAGGGAVFMGTLLGLIGTAIVGFLTFFLHHKLPYKKMLVLTGVLLGVVLVVMIGGSARTLQTLGVIGNHPLPFTTPDWWARWFEVVPTYETVGIQVLAGLFVVGSYYGAEWWSKEKRRRARVAMAPAADVTTTAAVLANVAAPLTVDHDATICGVATEPEFVRVPHVDEASVPTPAPVHASMPVTVRSAVAAASQELPPLGWNAAPLADPFAAPAVVAEHAPSSSAPAAPRVSPASEAAAVRTTTPFASLDLRPELQHRSTIAGSRPAPFASARAPFGARSDA
ncbi:MAG: iron permease [Thermoleophilia bacterium]|nr:iron permease [Thermoleophilia bacterium]